MRNYKTSKANRATYRYYDIEGKLRCELLPGQDGVTEILIQQLHAADDEKFDPNRREAYHIPVHYMAYTSGDAEEAEDRNSYLADESADPSIIFEKAISRAEFKREFHERWKHLTKEQQRLVIRKANGETNVAIAAEQGVSEAAMKEACAQVLGLAEYDAESVENRIEQIEAMPGNLLVFHLNDGSTHEVTWTFPSRSESWTDEMRQKAAEQMRRRYAETGH